MREGHSTRLQDREFQSQFYLSSNPGQFLDLPDCRVKRNNIILPCLGMVVKNKVTWWVAVGLGIQLRTAMQLDSSKRLRTTLVHIPSLHVAAAEK